MSVPSKRSTMLLNKLMHALHRALDNEDDNDNIKSNSDITSINVPNHSSMDLQRRGEEKMTRYFRCYFNAVSCF